MNNKILTLLQLVTTHAKPLKRGQSITIPCPDCGADMTISCSSANGHIWVICKQCGVKLSS